MLSWRSRLVMSAIVFLKSSLDVPKLPDIKIRRQPSASKPEEPAEPRVFFYSIPDHFWINTVVYYRMYILNFFFYKYVIGCFTCFRMFFKKHLKCSVSVNGSISPLFELSKSFKALLTFPSSIKRANRVAFLSELWFFALSLTQIIPCLQKKTQD